MRFFSRPRRRRPCIGLTSTLLPAAQYVINARSSTHDAHINPVPAPHPKPQHHNDERMWDDHEVQGTATELEAIRLSKQDDDDEASERAAQFAQLKALREYEKAEAAERAAALLEQQRAQWEYGGGNGLE